MAPARVPWGILPTADCAGLAAKLEPNVTDAVLSAKVATGREIKL